MEIRRVLNNMTPGAKRVGLGDMLTVEAGEAEGVDPGTLKQALLALAARVKELEDAAEGSGG